MIGEPPLSSVVGPALEAVNEVDTVVETVNGAGVNAASSDAGCPPSHGAAAPRHLAAPPRRLLRGSAPSARRKGLPSITQQNFRTPNTGSRRCVDRTPTGTPSAAPLSRWLCWCFSKSDGGP